MHRDQSDRPMCCRMFESQYELGRHRELVCIKEIREIVIANAPGLKRGPCHYMSNQLRLFLENSSLVVHCLM
jgi:hypothetical protein